MKKLLAIGEALIDMIPSGTGTIRDMESFSPRTGGAPANVCAAYSRLGGRSQLISQVGKDPFGDKILETLKEVHVMTESVLRTDDANTSLAFVSLQENGNRDFTFYRKPGADMLLSPESVREQWFKNAEILHFCSVSLGDTPMKKAHDAAIALADKNGMIISFDPNIRFPLWPDHAKLKQVIKEYIPKCHILKLSDEELPFITGKRKIENALPQLFQGKVRLIVYTEGENGCRAFTRTQSASAESLRVHAVDTTGAGDGFIGSFLYQLEKDGFTRNDLDQLTSKQMQKYLEFSSRFCAYSVQRYGAISSYPSMKEMKQK